MKVTNVLKKVGLGVLVAMLVGCARVGSVTNKMVNNTTSGVIYGGSALGDVSAESVCEAISNKDPRCSNAGDYYVVPVIAKFGYADGAVGINALVKKDFPNVETLKFNGRLGDKSQPFVKAKVIPGQLGEVLEIASTNGDRKCYWYGLPRTGGTVCPAYGYDYHKDFIGVVFR